MLTPSNVNPTVPKFYTKWEETDFSPLKLFIPVHLQLEVMCFDGKQFDLNEKPGIH